MTESRTASVNTDENGANLGICIYLTAEDLRKLELEPAHVDEVQYIVDGTQVHLTASKDSSTNSICPSKSN